MDNKRKLIGENGRKAKTKKQHQNEECIQISTIESQRKKLRI